MNPLMDKEFLLKLDKNRSKETYARITSLTFDEEPLEYIEGKVTSGSINVDGTSSIRRTCSLSMVSQDVNISDVYWGLSTKMKLEIGLANIIDSRYPDIIWFPQGIYIITSFNTNLATNGYTISVSGKDKGCLLNGDIGGQLFASVDFGKDENSINTFELYPTLTQSLYTAGFYYITLDDFKSYYISNDIKRFLINDADDPNSTVTDEDIIERLGLVAYKYTSQNKWYILDTGGAWTCPLSYKDTLKVSSDEWAKLCGNDEYGGNHIERRVGFNPFINYYQMYNNIEYTDLLLKDIIKESVHAYAKEPFHNIIINDIDDYGLELLQYNGDLDVYLLRCTEDTGADAYGWKFLVDGDKICYVGEYDTAYMLKDFSDPAKSLKQYDRVNDFLNTDPTEVHFVTETQNPNRKGYNVSVVHTGGTIGYRLTPLTYAGDLITNIGDTLASMLDKIKNMLGDFEYFYDVDGHFVFQRKKTFVNTSWNSLVTIEDKVIAEPASQTSAVTYNFEGNYLLSAIQNTPVLNNLKNDYSIWGKRKGLSGQDLPIHLRYAIQKKPYYYKSPYQPKIYVSDEYYRVQNVKQEKVAEIKSREELRNFSFSYADQIPDNFVKATINPSTGAITPGWWDIRDFYNYYSCVIDDENWKTGTMKWYSSNSLAGVAPFADIIGDPDNTKYCWLLGLKRVKDSIEDDVPNGYKWTCDGVEHQYTLETQHGLSNLSDTITTNTYYQDYYDTETNSWERAATKIKRGFIAPFSSCTDDHTYRYFLNQMSQLNTNIYDYSTYLFYNPQFPFMEAIEAEWENSYLTELEEALAPIADGEMFDESTAYTVELVDWREIIYQMAKDFFKHNNDITDDFLSKVNTCNCIDDNIIEGRKIYLYPGGYTGYESYYTDIEGFWRQLYCPPYDWNNLGLRFEVSEGVHKNVAVGIGGNSYNVENQYYPIHVTSVSCDFYLPAFMRQALIDEPQQGQEGPMFDDAYFNELNQEHADYVLKLRALYNYYGKFQAGDSEKEAFLNTYFRNDYKYWCIEAVQDPSKLNFWIDFLDTGELAQFDVGLVGARQKVVNDDKVTAIYLQEVPNLIFKKATDETVDSMTGYTYVNLSNSLANLFTISAQGKSAKDKLDELLYEFSYCIENVTITSIPIYYLQPNTRIYVYDEDAKINGEYIVTRFSLPLSYNGTMSITANKAPERIY